MPTKPVFLKPVPRPVVVPAAPEPAAKTPAEGLQDGRALARRFLPDAVATWAAVAFSPSSEASLWVRVQCARLLAEVAGAIARGPEVPRPVDGGEAS